MTLALTKVSCVLMQRLEVELNVDELSASGRAALQLAYAPVSVQVMRARVTNGP